MKIVPVIMPSANLVAAQRSLPCWRSRGYVVAVLVERERSADYARLADYVLPVREYHGYPWAIRCLCFDAKLAEFEVFVAAGDDMFPDPHPSADIAREFFWKFPDGLGVMQPIGDAHGCERICGSPWFGRRFCALMNRGRGPLWPGYNHYFSDLELKLVAERLGLLWQREDLVQRHEHWSWTTGVRPAHMRKHAALHERDRSLFLERRRQGFPGHELYGRSS